MLNVIREFMLMGLVTFGGGMAMIPLFLDLVLRYGWMSEEQFSNFIAISQSTPGPIGINMATFIGFGEGGWLGGILASIAVIVPGFVIAMLLSKFLVKHNDSPKVKRVIATMMATVLAMLVFAIYVLTGVSLGGTGWIGALIFVLALGLSFVKKVPMLLYIGIFAVLGIVFL